MILKPFRGWLRASILCTMMAGGGLATVPEEVVIWAPQSGPQTALLQCPVFEVFYGGARGGGKTDGMIGDWIQHSQLYGENAIGIFVRRNRTQLSEVIARTKQLFNKFPGAKYHEQKSEWVMPGGARLRFVYLERESDAENYQGHSYTRVYIEEVTNFPSPRPIDLLRATLRSAAGVPVGMRLTGNPGGPGHGWVKQRYIEPAPQGFHIIPYTDAVVMPDGTTVEVSLERVFIPSKLKDNYKLMESQPTYVLQLRQTGSEQLVKAWLNGDWDSIQGAYFSDFHTDSHVLPSAIRPTLPKHWTRFRAIDWGSAKPFSVGWYAVADGKTGPTLQLPARTYTRLNKEGEPEEITVPPYVGLFPQGALIKYREWYGWNGKVNEGCKMTAEGVAQGIRVFDKEDEDAGSPVLYGVCDPSMFKVDGGVSIAEKMASCAVPWLRADNQRKSGWEEMHVRFQHGPAPLLYFLDCCSHTIRTIPELQHDEKDPEDLNTEGEDHAGDETRYACNTHPIVKDAAPIAPGWTPPKTVERMTFMDLVNLNTKRRTSREGKALV